MDLKELYLWFMLMGPLLLSPGPMNIAVATVSSRRGLGAAMVFALGASIVNCFILTLMGYGMSAVYMKYRSIFRILEILGALYIIHLGIKIIRAKPTLGKKEEKALGFKQAVILQLLNVKIYPVMMMMFSQFLNGSSVPTIKILQISSLVVVTSFICYTVWAWLGTTMSKTKSPVAQGIQRYSFGILLALTGVWLVFQ